MKTIFNFNPTDKEIKEILPSGMTKDEYLSWVGQDSAYYDIALLHYFRGNYLRMKWYAIKIKDANMRNSFFRTIAHP